MPRLIGFGHRRRVGKNEAARILAFYLASEGYRVEVTSFARSLKRICHDLFGWGGMQNELFYENDPLAKETILPAIGKSPRQILIEVGNLLRQVHPDVWVKSALKFDTSPDYVILTDVRYPNEADELLRQGGTIVRIDRDCVPKSNDVADCALEGYPDWDLVIHNDSSLYEFESKVIRLGRTLAQAPSVNYGDRYWRGA